MQVRMNRPISSLLFLCFHVIINAFDRSNYDFDAYGVKIASNDNVFVEAYNKEKYFLVQFAPYGNTNASLQCRLPYANSSHYVYSIGAGAPQPLTKEPHVYISGVAPVAVSFSAYGDEEGESEIFIGILINHDTTNTQSYLSSGKSVSCDYLRIEELLSITSDVLPEYFVIAVEPFGRYAIGLATDIIFRYHPFPNGTMMRKQPTTVWPNSSNFMPCAADAAESFTIVAGFVKNSGQSRTRATPTVHLLWNDNLTVLSSWTYKAPENSWQSYLMYNGLETWNKQFTMSVKVNSADFTRVLVGMPFLNIVFLFQVSNNGTNLTLASSMTYEKSVGFGKSVTWLSNTQAAILYSAYSPDYSTFYWSKIYVYTCLNDTTLPSSPTAVIPSAQQPLPSIINANFIRMISTPNTLAILDQVGGVLMIMSEAPGSYASTDTTKSPVATATPVVSHGMPCIGGTFKADVGVHPCSPCPVGSRSPGDIDAVACLNCSADAFCPLGAVYEIERAALTSLSQAYPYPRSPDMTVYEDLLINNMVTFGSTGHCRRISPMFWAVILLVLVVLMLLGMASLNLCVKEPRRDRWRSMIKRAFLKTDLVVSDTFGRISQ